MSPSPQRPRRKLESSSAPGWERSRTALPASHHLSLRAGPAPTAARARTWTKAPSRPHQWAQVQAEGLGQSRRLQGGGALELHHEGRVGGSSEEVRPETKLYPQCLIDRVTPAVLEHLGLNFVESEIVAQGHPLQFPVAALGSSGKHMSSTWLSLCVTPGKATLDTISSCNKRSPL